MLRSFRFEGWECWQTGRYVSDRKSFLMAFFTIGLVDGDHTVCGGHWGNLLRLISFQGPMYHHIEFMVVLP